MLVTEEFPKNSAEVNTNNKIGNNWRDKVSTWMHNNFFPLILVRQVFLFRYLNKFLLKHLFYINSYAIYEDFMYSQGSKPISLLYIFVTIYSIQQFIQYVKTAKMMT